MRWIWALLLLTGGCAGTGAPGDDPPDGSSGGAVDGALPADGAGTDGTTAPPPDGPFFAGAVEEEIATVTTAGQSEGDLWPSCWSNDDELYAANGDGRAFDVQT